MITTIELPDDYTGMPTLVAVALDAEQPLHQVDTTLQLLQYHYEAGPRRALCRAHGWVWAQDPRRVVLVTGNN